MWSGICERSKIVPVRTVNFVPATVAHEHAGLGLAAHLGHVVGAAQRAIGAIWPAIGLHVGDGLGFVGKDRVGEIASHT